MKIVDFQEKFRDRVRFVCLSTGPDNALTDKKTGDYIVNSYCNYYIDCEPENCFVLTDDDDSAVGYILCAQDLKKYKKNFKPYGKIVKRNAGIYNFEVFAEHFALGLFSSKYPAHMHIDILDDYTGQGYGSQMIEKLLKHLTDKGIKGIMLIVSSGNSDAVRFYKRHGFSVILSAFGGTVMGLDLQNNS